MRHPARVQGFEAKSRRPSEQVCATLLPTSCIRSTNAAVIRAGDRIRQPTDKERDVPVPMSRDALPARGFKGDGQ